MLKVTLTDLFIFPNDAMPWVWFFFFFSSHYFPCCYKDVVKQLNVYLKKHILLCCNVNLDSLTLWSMFCSFSSKRNLKAGWKMMFSIAEIKFNLVLTVYLGETCVWFFPCRTCLWVVRFAAAFLCWGCRGKTTHWVIAVAPRGGRFLVWGA